MAEPPPPLFLTTRWSVVLTAQDGAAPGASEALEILCRSYWYPLYAFVRRSGHGPHDAQDLTQEFFARLLEKEWLHTAVRERGRFRTFLLVAMKRFLAKEWHRTMARKRGAGLVPLPLDTVDAERRYAGEPVLAAADIFERRWAMTLLDQALELLSAEYEGREFSRLKEWLTAGRGEIPYAELAAQLGINQGAARVAIHRLRKRFRAIFRELITQTVDASSDVEDEMRHLAAILGRGV
jgi:RNA polymerase sigma-70 factor (ECF subfamily)